MSFLNIFKKLGFSKMNKLTDSSSNNEIDDDYTWEEIKQMLDNGP
jgi:hypothetical protein